MSSSISKTKKYLPHLLGVIVVVSVGIGLVAFVKSMLTPLPEQKKMIRQVTLIQPPPPPPKLDKPPEPEIEEEVEIEEPEPIEDEIPEPLADEAPLGEDLALDADGVAGSDAFNLLAKKGGRDLISSTGSVYGWYASSIQSDILDFLSEDTEIRKREYSINIQLWIDRAGKIRKSKLNGTTGDKLLDKSLLMALKSIKRFSEKPPDNLPQPINIQIRSRI
jgi:outer membrane biosynthesis protein TonB